MYLQNITIKNWKSIDKIKVNLKNLMVFIGRANHGKSSIFSAILFFLGERNFRKTDLKEQDREVNIIGEFQVESVRKLERLREYLYHGNHLKVEILIDREKKIHYFVYKGSEKREVSYKEYSKIVENLEVLFIPSRDTDSDDLTDFFYKKLINILEKEGTMGLVDLEEIVGIYSCLKEAYASKGLQRNVFFNIFRILVRESKKSKTSVLGSTLILYEEPELYLHPQAERELYDTLLNLSKLGSQVYICTHSGSFIDLNNYKSICIVRRDAEGSKVVQQKGEIFSKDEVKKFNMSYWINPDRSELFFAKKVVLVEGQTDKIVIPYLAKKLDIYKYDYSVIECGSKSTLPQYIKLLNKFRIPYSVVYDKDEHIWREREERNISHRKNKEIQRLINYEIGNYIEFENDIEEELGGVREKKSFKNKPFLALKQIMRKNYAIPSGLAKKIEKIYY